MESRDGGEYGRRVSHLPGDGKPGSAAGKPASIVNIASATAYIGSKNGKSHYAASKGGVISFTVSFAKEAAAYDIRVNAVAPGMHVYRYDGGTA